MRILWNADEKRFESQFSPGGMWENDKVAAQAAGFHSDGPPAWIWYASKASCLTKLKESRSSISALSITREALDAYNRLLAIEQRNDELKAWAKEQKKKLKKQEERDKIEAQHEADGECGGDVEPEYQERHYYPLPDYWKGKTEIGRDDLPADVLARSVQREFISTERAKPTGTCGICGESIYFYESQDPPICFWCEGNGEEKFFEELIA
jgi:hypothetical protein